MGACCSGQNNNNSSSDELDGNHHRQSPLSSSGASAPAGGARVMAGHYPSSSTTSAAMHQSALADAVVPTREIATSTNDDFLLGFRSPRPHRSSPSSSRSPHAPHALPPSGGGSGGSRHQSNPTNLNTLPVSGSSVLLLTNASGTVMIPEHSTVLATSDCADFDLRSSAEAAGAVGEGDAFDEPPTISYEQALRLRRNSVLGKRRKSLPGHPNDDNSEFQAMLREAPTTSVGIHPTNPLHAVSRLPGRHSLGNNNAAAPPEDATASAVFNPFVEPFSQTTPMASHVGSSFTLGSLPTSIHGAAAPHRSASGERSGAASTTTAGVSAARARRNRGTGGGGVASANNSGRSLRGATSLSSAGSGGSPNPLLQPLSPDGVNRPLLSASGSYSVASQHVLGSSSRTAGGGGGGGASCIPILSPFLPQRQLLSDTESGGEALTMTTEGPVEGSSSVRAPVDSTAGGCGRNAVVPNPDSLPRHSLHPQHCPPFLHVPHTSDGNFSFNSTLRVGPSNNCAVSPFNANGFGGSAYHSSSLGLVPLPPATAATHDERGNARLGNSSSSRSRSKRLEGSMGSQGNSSLSRRRPHHQHHQPQQQTQPAAAHPTSVPPPPRSVDGSTFASVFTGPQSSSSAGQPNPSSQWQPQGGQTTSADTFGAGESSISRATFSRRFSRAQEQQPNSPGAAALLTDFDDPVQQQLATYSVTDGRHVVVVSPAPPRTVQGSAGAFDTSSSSRSGRPPPHQVLTSTASSQQREEAMSFFHVRSPNPSSLAGLPFPPHPASSGTVGFAAGGSVGGAPTLLGVTLMGSQLSPRGTSFNPSPRGSLHHSHDNSINRAAAATNPSSGSGSAGATVLKDPSLQGAGGRNSSGAASPLRTPSYSAAKHQYQQTMFAEFDSLPETEVDDELVPTATTTTTATGVEDGSPDGSPFLTRVVSTLPVLSAARSSDKDRHRHATAAVDGPTVHPMRSPNHGLIEEEENGGPQLLTDAHRRPSSGISGNATVPQGAAHHHHNNNQVWTGDVTPAAPQQQQQQQEPSAPLSAVTAPAVLMRSPHTPYVAVVGTFRGEPHDGHVTHPLLLHSPVLGPQQRLDHLRALPPTHRTTTTTTSPLSVRESVTIVRDGGGGMDAERKPDPFLPPSSVLVQLGDDDERSAAAAVPSRDSAGSALSRHSSVVQPLPLSSHQQQQPRPPPFQREFPTTALSPSSATSSSRIGAYSYHATGEEALSITGTVSPHRVAAVDTFAEEGSLGDCMVLASSTNTATTTTTTTTTTVTAEASQGGHSGSRRVVMSRRASGRLENDQHEEGRDADDDVEGSTCSTPPLVPFHLFETNSSATPNTNRTHPPSVGDPSPVVLPPSPSVTQFPPTPSESHSPALMTHQMLPPTAPSSTTTTTTHNNAALLLILQDVGSVKLLQNSRRDSNDVAGISTSARSSQQQGIGGGGQGGLSASHETSSGMTSGGVRNGVGLLLPPSDVTGGNSSTTTTNTNGSAGVPPHVEPPASSQTHPPQHPQDVGMLELPQFVNLTIRPPPPVIHTRHLMPAKYRHHHPQSNTSGRRSGK